MQLSDSQVTSIKECLEYLINSYNFTTMIGTHIPFAMINTRRHISQHMS